MILQYTNEGIIRYIEIGQTWVRNVNSSFQEFDRFLGCDVLDQLQSPHCSSVSFDQDNLV